MVKVYLSRKGVPFTEHNVSLEPEAKKTLMEMGYRTTPLTVIGDQIIVGYKPPQMEAALAQAGD